MKSKYPPVRDAMWNRPGDVIHTCGSADVTWRGEQPYMMAMPAPAFQEQLDRIERKLDSVIEVRSERSLSHWGLYQV